MITTITFFILALVFLVYGADLLVKGASSLAQSLGISSLIIGLTVVAFGTSAPEMAVSVKAGLSLQSSIALGNVVGSNIFNILLILGISALITPLVISKQLIKLDLPIVVGISVIAWLMALDYRISRTEGIILFAGIIIYILTLIRIGKKQNLDADQTDKQECRYLKNAVLIVVGLILLVIGSDWLIDSVVIFAEHLGVSKQVVGLTIVSAGTSLPEVVTSIVASIKGERDIAVGNVIGSNIFNILAVLGLTAIATPGGVEVSQAMVAFDLPVMLAVALACLPVFIIGRTISRPEGLLFFCSYLLYISFIVLVATQSELLEPFKTAITYYVAPFSLIALTLILFRKTRASKLT